MMTSFSPSFEGENTMFYVTKDANGKKLFETERKLPILKKDSPVPLDMGQTINHKVYSNNENVINEFIYEKTDAGDLISTRIIYSDTYKNPLKRNILEKVTYNTATGECLGGVKRDAQGNLIDI